MYWHVSCNNAVDRQPPVVDPTNDPFLLEYAQEHVGLSDPAKGILQATMTQLRGFD